MNWEALIALVLILLFLTGLLAIPTADALLSFLLFAAVIACVVALIRSITRRPPL